MDEFESKHVQGAGREYFRDKIPVPQRLAWLGAAGMVAATVGLGLITNDWLTASLIGVGVGSFGFLGNVALMGLRMVVTDAGVDVWVGVRHRRIALDDIAGCELDEYRLADHPFGRGHVKWGPRGRAYVGAAIVPGVGDRGVRIELRSGSTVFLATHRPGDLKRAIDLAIGAVDAHGPAAAGDPSAAATPVTEHAAAGARDPAPAPAPAPKPEPEPEPEEPVEDEYEYVGVEAGPPAGRRRRG